MRLRSVLPCSAISSSCGAPTGETHVGRKHCIDVFSFGSSRNDHRGQTMAHSGAKAQVQQKREEGSPQLYLGELLLHDWLDIVLIGAGIG